jgi:type IV pilus assembly protein PilB
LAKTRPRIGDILVEAGLLTREQVEEAQARSRGRRLGQVLVESGLVSEEEIAQALSRQLGIPLIDLRRNPPDPRCVALVPESLARAHHLVPVQLIDRSLFVALADPTDVVGIDAVEKVTGLSVKPAVAPESEVAAAIQRSYGLYVHPDLVLGEMARREEVTSPAIHVVDFLLSHAVSHRATDVHIEPEEEAVRVRYRIDGFLYTVTVLPKEVHAAVVSRLKVLSRLDIAEQRLPQDGAFEMTIEGTALDIRVSTIPTVYGERVALRLLDKHRQVLGLDQLGMRPAVREVYERLIQRPYGLILVSGPTGSGKTTTLASTMIRLNSGERNILTIEDPIEYRIRGVSQVQVNPDAGLDFATGLRSVLRHDPDILMVGEIRDPETARIATHAALAGTLVLATIHTNDAPTALLRLVQMGVPPYLIASAVIGVLSQRLVRLLCPSCKQPAAQPQDPLAWIERVVGEKPAPGEEIPPPHISLARGCRRCQFTGYLGRTGIFEILAVTPRIQELLLEGASQKDIEAQARAEGMRSMRLDGALKVLAGLTTLEEVRRVTDLGDVL